MVKKFSRVFRLTLPLFFSVTFGLGAPAALAQNKSIAKTQLLQVEELTTDDILAGHNSNTIDDWATGLPYELDTKPYHKQFSRVLHKAQVFLKPSDSVRRVIVVCEESKGTTSFVGYAFARNRFEEAQVISLFRQTTHCSPGPAASVVLDAQLRPGQIPLQIYTRPSLSWEQLKSFVIQIENSVKLDTFTVLPSFPESVTHLTGDIGKAHEYAFHLI